MQAGEDFPLKLAVRWGDRRKDSLTQRLEDPGGKDEERGKKEGAREGGAERHGPEKERGKRDRQREEETERQGRTENYDQRRSGSERDRSPGRDTERANRVKRQLERGDTGLDPEARMEKRKMSERRGGGGDQTTPPAGGGEKAALQTIPTPQPLRPTCAPCVSNPEALRQPIN